MDLLNHLKRRLHRFMLPLGILIVCLIASLDYVTKLSVEVFYLVAVMLVTWTLGRRAGVFIAVISASVVLLVDLATNPDPDPIIPIWNAFVTLGIFLIVTYVLAAAIGLARENLRQETERAALLALTGELKTELLQAVSHDVRTPLASIKASATILLDPTVPWTQADRHELLEGINEQCDRLDHLAGQLLDMSRIDGGMLRLDRDWYSIEEVINAVLHRLHFHLAGHPVEVEVPPNLPLVLIDFPRIEQVLTNLLENAGKYTPLGTPITVRARTVADQLEVSVVDRGPGLSPEDLAHLFDKFAPVRHVGRPLGTGLGLSIVRGIVQVHGGQVTAENSPGGGWCVTFSLPLEPIPPPPAPAAVEVCLQPRGTTDAG
ncbi:MAG: ATP-binding protein [Chloroflexia bacterium]